jgi:hypothetical protein
MVTLRQLRYLEALAAISRSSASPKRGGAPQPASAIETLCF